MRFLDFQRQGRSDAFASEFDLEAEEYVPLPKGDVHKKKEVIQDVTLHDLDVANAAPQVVTDSFQIVNTYQQQRTLLNCLDVYFSSDDARTME